MGYLRELIFQRGCNSHHAMRACLSFYRILIFFVFSISITFTSCGGGGGDSGSPDTDSISLSETGTYTFPAAIPGYGAQTPLTVTVTNTGNQATGNLDVIVSWSSTNSFTLSTTTISSIAVGGTDTFTVVPRVGLSAGTYSSNVMVSGDNGIVAASFYISFTVNGPYIINGSGSSFTATKGGATIGTANQPIQNVINSIRSNANSADCVIQFGDGVTALNIGSASASFNNTGGIWGLITLTGKITSITSSGTISIRDNVSLISTGDITNSAASTGIAVYTISTGAVTISSGTVSATTNIAIWNDSTGAVIISGGMVSATTGIAIVNTSTGSVTISGGTVSSTAGNAAVLNDYTGKITVSGTALVTSANTAIGGTIYLNNNGTATTVRLEILGGTVSNTSTGTGMTIYNDSTGTVIISGGTVSKSGSSGYAVYNASTGKVTITSPPAVIIGPRFNC